MVLASINRGRRDYTFYFDFLREKIKTPIITSASRT